MKKKIISSILSLAMLLSLFPAAAFAVLADGATGAVTFQFNDTGIVLGDLTNIDSDSNGGGYTVTAGTDGTFKLDTTSANDATAIADGTKVVKVTVKYGANGVAEEISAADGVYTLDNTQYEDTIAVDVTVEDASTASKEISSVDITLNTANLKVGSVLPQAETDTQGVTLTTVWNAGTQDATDVTANGTAKFTTAGTTYSAKITIAADEGNGYSLAGDAQYTLTHNGVAGNKTAIDDTDPITVSNITVEAADEPITPGIVTATATDVVKGEDGTLGNTITVTLTGDTFENPAEVTNFSVTVGDAGSAAPLNPTKVEVSADNENVATLTMAWGNTTAEVNDKITVSIDAAAITNYSETGPIVAEAAVVADSSVDPGTTEPLTSVLGQTITVTGNGTGEDEAAPKTASITVSATTTAVTADDIVVVQGATATLYSDDFKTEAEAAGVTLSANDPTDVYITVTVDTAATYYKVTITKAATADAYTVTLKATPANGGTVTAKVDDDNVSSGSEVDAGEDVVITAKAADGYTFTSMKVNDAAVTPDVDQTTGEVTYTITGLAADTTVEVTFTQKTYEVTVTSPTNGSVALTPTAYAQGATVEFTTTPDAGYVTSSVTAVYDTNKTVEVTYNQDTGKYSFEMPAAAVTVNVEFTAVTINAGPIDVNESAFNTAEGLKDLDSTAKEALTESMGNVSVTADAAALVEKNPDAKDALLKAMEENNGATIEMVVYTAVAPVSYTPATQDNPNAVVTVDIAQMGKITKTDGGQETVIGEPTELTVTGDIPVTIGLPTGFAEKNDTVYVTHKTDVHEATVNEDNGALTVTITANGLSPFTVSIENPAVAKDGSNNLYTTLEAAIKGVAVDGTETITLLKNVELDGDIIVNEAKTITITKGAYTITGGEIKAGNSVTMTYDEATGTYTFTAKTSYTVTVAATTNGTVTVDKQSAYEGDTVTITATADQGYEVDTMTVTENTSSDPVAVTNNAFTMPANNVTVTVTFKQAQGGGDNSGGTSGGSGGGGGVSSNVTVSSATNGKVTVTPTAPSKGATVTINLTPDSGYQVGSVTVTDKDGNAVELTKVNDTQYTFTMPDGKVTVRATFIQVETPSSTGFTDVAASAYYADAVKWAVEQGITNGLTSTTFGPDNSCTRGQMVTFLWRAAGSPAATGTNSFSDVASGEYYYDAVLWAVEKGITNGTSATTFSPNATVTRGQTVTFLYRYAGSPAVSGDSSFADVASSDFYASAVAWAVAEEITNGTSSTTFSPASNCTRGQIVTFMYRQMAE